MSDHHLKAIRNDLRALLRTQLAARARSETGSGRRFMDGKIAGLEAALVIVNLALAEATGAVID